MLVFLTSIADIADDGYVTVACACGVACVQVFGVARQVLSLVAGGAIDEWLLGLLRGLRQEHCCARALHALQQQLWPGGAWFQSLPENQHPVCALARSACPHACMCRHAVIRAAGRMPCAPRHVRHLHGPTASNVRVLACASMHDPQGGRRQRLRPSWYQANSSICFPLRVLAGCKRTMRLWVVRLSRCAARGSTIAEE